MKVRKRTGACMGVLPATPGVRLKCDGVVVEASLWRRLSPCVHPGRKTVQKQEEEVEKKSETTAEAVGGETG